MTYSSSQKSVISIKGEVEYLGVIVENGHVKMDLVKLKGIIEWPIPQNV
jgi:hypothetical protein